MQVFLEKERKGEKKVTLCRGGKRVEGGEGSERRGGTKAPQGGWGKDSLLGVHTVLKA